MAKSKARKKREHDKRNGKFDVTLNRGISPDFSMHVRKTPTLKERKEKEWRKYKRNHLRKYTSDDFYFNRNVG